MQVSVHHVRRSIWSLVLGLPLATAISGCSNTPEDEFLEKLKAKYEQEGERCFGIRFIDLHLYELNDIPDKKFVSVRATSKAQDSSRVMLDRLMQLGYVENTKPRRFRGDDFASYDGYPLTEKGSKYIRWDEGICVGRIRVTGIQEYTQPGDMGGIIISEVTFTYEADLNEFATQLGLEKRLREEKFDGTGKATFTQTNKGWRLESARL